MKKLFILSSFPHCGPAQWLSRDCDFPMLQTERKMLTALWLLWLGCRTDAAAGSAPPLLLLPSLTDFSRTT